MSKTPRSSRTHSRSASRSRSGSDSHSCSRSRSSSKSRSRKHRYGSRSRSRSRSYSPFHNRGQKHPREYQNHREFRGYHRGFRRPYYFRGRGRGFFRGRFQRGGGGYNNYRSNNWQNWQNWHNQHPQQKQQRQQQKQQQQKQHAHSPKKGRSRTPKKRSSTPQSISHSHNSDRSSSLRSHQSSSSSSSQKKTASVKQNCKAGTEVLSAPKESPKDGGDATLSVQEANHPEVAGNTHREKAPKTWLFPINNNSSPKKAIPHIQSAVSAVHVNPASSESGPVSGNSGATSNGATYSQSVAITPTNSSPQTKSPTTVFSGFGLFSKADEEEDTVAISIAFKKFLEEQKNKKQALADKSMENVADNGNTFPENRNSKCEGTFDRPSGPRLSRSAEQNNKKESEKYKHVDKGNTSSSSFRQAMFSEDGEAEDSEDTEPHLQMRVVESEGSNRKSKVEMSARELFEEHFKRLDDRAWDDELEAFLINREKERAASILSTLSKREKFARKFEELSPERPSKVKRKDKMTLSPSPTYKAVSRRISETQEPEMFMNLGDESSPRASGKRERDFTLRMDSLSEDLARSSVVSNDRRNTTDLVHCDKKGLQNRWCNNLCRRQTELFAQHVISIVHYVTVQHFSSSGLTLSDRFAMYQRLAAEKEIMKPRKSPEIHRRIDVSPSAFLRHSFLFDELKDSVDSSSKAEVKQFKGDTMDLLMNVEQCKKYLSRETNEKQGEQGELGQSPQSSMENSTGKSSKRHKKSKKSKKKRERSLSSSSSSFVNEEETTVTTESIEKNSALLQVRDRVGATETGQAHGGTLDENNVQGERKWVNTQGHGQSVIPRVKGRFILRRPTISITTINSKWNHDKFKASGDNGEPGNRDQKEQNST